MNKSKFTAFLAVFVALHWSVASAEPVSDRITVTVRGRGPDVVLIPGLASSSVVWETTVRHLEEHYRLHVIQVAGFAGSTSRANAHGAVIQPTVEAIHAYIKTNQLKAPRLIGHSLGGLMGGMLAVQHPEDVGRLMVVDALPFFSAAFGAKDVASATPQAAAMRDRLLAQTQDDYAQGERQFIHILVKSPRGREEATSWAVTSDKSVVARALYEDLTTDLRPRLHEIKSPVTILYAWDASSGMPQSTADALYRENYASLPNKTLVRIDGSYHFIMLDQPELFAAQTDAFLK
jgi:pimeloyl-ACP methyl ester carboxylesterase